MLCSIVFLVLCLRGVLAAVWRLVRERAPFGLMASQSFLPPTASPWPQLAC